MGGKVNHHQRAFLRPNWGQKVPCKNRKWKLCSEGRFWNSTRPNGDPLAAKYEQDVLVRQQKRGGGFSMALREHGSSFSMPD